MGFGRVLPQVIVDDLAIERFERFSQAPPKDKWRPPARPEPSQWQPKTESPVYRNDNTLRSYQLDGFNWLTYCW